MAGRVQGKTALNKDGTFKTKVFDDMNRIPDDQFEELSVKGCEVKALLENSGIGIGISWLGWRSWQLVITKKANNVVMLSLMMMRRMVVSVVMLTLRSE